MQGTHETQNIVVTPTSVGLVVTGEFINGSTAIGILAIVYSLNNESDIHYYYASRLLGQRQVSATFGGISNGPKSVSLFVIESNGLPFNRTATKVRRVIIPTMNKSTSNNNNKIRLILVVVCDNIFLGTLNSDFFSKVIMAYFSILITLILLVEVLSASHVPSWTVLPLTVSQWYIDESLSSALVD